MWPEGGGDYLATGCTVTNTSSAAFSDGRIRVDSDSPLSVVAENPAEITDVYYARVSSTMKFEPFAAGELPPVPAGAKTAVIAVISGADTNFWVAAGVESLSWVDTGVAADLAREVTVEVVVTYGVEYMTAEWKLDSVPFTCRVARAPVLGGVAFSGRCDISSCWGDVDHFGDLANFFISGVPEEVLVTITTTNGDVIARSGMNDYVYVSGGRLELSFTLPDGWRFIDGATERSDVIDSLDAGGYTPFGGRGIMAVEIGPEDGWMLYYDGAEPLLEARFSESELEDAFSAMKDGMVLDWCYSEKDRTFRFNEDGTVSVGDDPRQWAAKPRYHFVDIGIGVPSLSIDEEEATITSISRCDLDESSMSVGSVQNTFSGFGYSVIYADDLGFSEGLGETEPVKGNGGKLELVAPKGDKGGRFYRIRITD